MMIQEARPEDAELLAGVQERASLAALGHIFPPERHPFPRDAVQTRWKEFAADPGRLTLIALRGDDPVGAACVSAEWLEGLYVVPEQWGSGHAGSLHDRALDVVRELGSTRCHLWVLEENLRARRFYERRGWRENGETRVVDYPPNPLDVGYALDLGRACVEPNLWMVHPSG